jgi:hypothetical protein
MVAEELSADPKPVSEAVNAVGLVCIRGPTPAFVAPRGVLGLRPKIIPSDNVGGPAIGLGIRNVTGGIS